MRYSRRFDGTGLYTQKRSFRCCSREHAQLDVSYLKTGIDAILHDVDDGHNKLLKLRQSRVDILQIAVDVHRGPREGGDAWPQKMLEAVKVRLQERGRDRPDHRRYTSILLKRREKKREKRQSYQNPHS